MTNHEPPKFPMPRDPAQPLEPPAGYAELRERCPVTKVVLWDGREAWLVSRYTDVRQVLGDARASANTSRPGFPFVRAGGARARQAVMVAATPLASLDPPRHGEVRRVMLADFMSRKMEQRREAVQRVVDGLIAAMVDAHARRPPDDPGWSIDLVQSLALPLPSRVIGDILGVPDEDHGLFQTEAALASSGDPEVVGPAYRRLCEYLDRLVTAKERRPADDLLSRLVVEQLRTGAMTRAELVANAYQVLSAGHKTTTNMIALGTLLLLRRPEQLAKLRDDPGLAGSAVEELLRYLTVAQYVTHRIALEDIDVGAETIRAGDAVIALVASANRDPGTFSAPDDLDILRQNNNHLAFGTGSHFCLGAALARLELQVVFSTLFERLPGLRLAGAPSELAFDGEGEIFGVVALPVTW